MSWMHRLWCGRATIASRSLTVTHGRWRCPGTSYTLGRVCVYISSRRLTGEFSLNALEFHSIIVGQLHFIHISRYRHDDGSAWWLTRPARSFYVRPAMCGGLDGSQVENRNEHSANSDSERLYTCMVYPTSASRRTYGSRTTRTCAAITDAASYDSPSPLPASLVGSMNGA